MSKPSRLRREALRRARSLRFERLEPRELLDGEGAVTSVAISTQDPVRVIPGSIINFSAVAVGSTSPEFDFRMRSSQGEWFTARSYSIDATWAWDTSSFAQDVYYVGVFARSQGSTARYEAASSSITVVLSSVAPATSANISIINRFLERGESALVSTSASGGSGAFEYKYRFRSSAGEWQTIRDYSTDSSITVDTLSLAYGKYYIGSFVRSLGSPADFEVASVPVEFTVLVDPATNLVLTSSLAGRIAPGQLVQFQASGTGAMEEYEFRFILRSSQSEWATLRSYSSSSELTLDTSTLAQDIYYIGVLARRKGLTVPYELAATPIEITVTDKPPATGGTLTASATSLVQGGDLSLLAAGSGGNGEYEYLFRYRSEGGEWTVLRNYSTEPQYLLNTETFEVGQYYFAVFIRTLGSPAAREVAVAPITFQVLEKPFSGLSIESDSPLRIMPGTSVEFSLRIVGGYSQYEFAFVLRSRNGEWAIVNGYSTALTWTWTTAGLPDDYYYIGAYARRVGTTGLLEFAATPIEMLVSSVTPALNAEVLSEKNRTLIAGDIDRYTVNATGSGPALEYAFILRSSTGDWTTVRPYSTDSSWQFDTTGYLPGAYYVGALVRSVGSVAAYDLWAPPIEQLITAENLVPVRLRENAIVVVAACDSSDAFKAIADYVGDCYGDQAEINAAIQSLPSSGGRVQIAPGTYDIRTFGDVLGGVIIDRSNVVLEGAGGKALLTLADHQNVNVIRIIGDGLSNISIKGLTIDGNWRNNVCDTFECSGIFARSNGSTPLKSITVAENHLENAVRLNVFLDAVDARILNNFLGDSGSDSVEILTGPGQISGNYAEIDDITGYVFSTDQADYVSITNNVVIVTATGRITESIVRTWVGRVGHAISDNRIVVYGFANRLLEINSYLTTVSGNVLMNLGGRGTGEHILLNAGALLSGNIITRADVVFSHTTTWGSIAVDNLLLNGSTLSTRDNELLGTPVVVFQNNLSIS